MDHFIYFCLTLLQQTIIKTMSKIDDSFLLQWGDLSSLESSSDEIVKKHNYYYEKFDTHMITMKSRCEKLTLGDFKKIFDEFQIEFISMVLNKLIKAIREEILDDISDDTSYDNIRGIKYAEYIIFLMDTSSIYGNSFLLKISENESYRFLTSGNLRVICYVVEKRWFPFWRLQDGVESLWEYLRFPQKLTKKIKQ